MNKNEVEKTRAEMKNDGRRFIFHEDKITTLTDDDPLKIAQSLQQSWFDTFNRLTYSSLSIIAATDGGVRLNKGEFSGLLEFAAGTIASFYIIRGWLFGSETRLWMKNFVESKLRERITSVPEANIENATLEQPAQT